MLFFDQFVGLGSLWVQVRVGNGSSELLDNGKVLAKLNKNYYNEGKRGIN